MRPRLTYANVVSSLALFLALSGGVVYAASRIGTKSIKGNAVTTRKIAPRAVTGKRIAKRAVGATQLAPRSVGNPQVADDSIGPGKLQFPVFFVGSPTGGSAPVTGNSDPYPIDGGTWTQKTGQINVVFGEGTATLAYDGTGSGSCQVFFDIRIDGQQVGGGQLQTDSTTPVAVTQSLGAQPTVDPVTSQERELTIQAGSNGDCTPGSTIDSTRFRILDFG